MTKGLSRRVTRNTLWLAAGAVAVWFSSGVGVAVWFSSGVAVAASSINGTVTFDGKAPTLAPIAMDAEVVCHKKHGGKPAPNEALVLGAGNSMGNIMVWVSKGLPTGKTLPRSQ